MYSPLLVKNTVSRELSRLRPQSSPYRVHVFASLGEERCQLSAVSTSTSQPRIPCSVYTHVREWVLTYTHTLRWLRWLLVAHSIARPISGVHTHYIRCDTIDKLVIISTMFQPMMLCVQILHISSQTMWSWFRSRELEDHAMAKFRGIQARRVAAYHERLRKSLEQRQVQRNAFLGRMAGRINDGPQSTAWLKRRLRQLEAEAARTGEDVAREMFSPTALLLMGFGVERDSHPCTHTHTHTHTLTHTHNTLTHTLTSTQASEDPPAGGTSGSTEAPTPTNTHKLAHTLTHTQTHAHHTHSHTLTHTQTHTHSHAPTHTHTHEQHTHTHSPHHHPGFQEPANRSVRSGKGGKGGEGGDGGEGGEGV
jgi:hypothetical protein